MNPKKFRIILLAAIWCGTSVGAYYFVRQSTESGKAVAANNRGKGLTDRGANIILSTVNHPVMSTKDLEQSKGRPNADTLKAWADSLDPADCPGVLDELQKMAGGEPRDAMMAAMIASWAARDPQGYLKDYSKVADPRVRETGVGAALKAMAATDPKAAIAFMSASTEGIPANMIAMRYRNAIQGMAANDPQAAFAFVQGIDANLPANAQIQRQGLNAVADAMAASGNFTDALKLFSTLPDAQKATASGELMSQWAQLAPTDAAKYIATIDDPTQRSTAAAQVVRNWSRDDPAAAAAWAVQFDTSSVDANGQPTGGQALATAVRTWSRYDLDGPAQFLNTLPPSPQTDSAVATFAAQARNVDASTALTWSGQITDPTTRDKAIGSVAIRMLANGDTAGLQAAITANQITPDQVTWLQSLPTDNPQALNRMARRMGANFTTNANRPAPWAPAATGGAAPGPQGAAGPVGGPRAGGGFGPRGGGRGGAGG